MAKKRKFSKGRTIHRTKRAAERVRKAAKDIGIPTRLVKLKDGYRVDKDWS